MRPQAILVFLGGFATLPASVSGWEFPRVGLVASGGFGQHPLSPSGGSGNDDDVDIVTGSQFNGLRTFANLPYVNCFSDEEAESKKYDIAVLGAPFDTVRLPQIIGRPWDHVFRCVSDH